MQRRREVPCAHTTAVQMLRRRRHPNKASPRNPTMLGLSKQPASVAVPRSCMTPVLIEGNSPLHAVLCDWRSAAHTNGRHIALSTCEQECKSCARSSGGHDWRQPAAPLHGTKHLMLFSDTCAGAASQHLCVTTPYAMREQTGQDCFKSQSTPNTKAGTPFKHTRHSPARAASWPTQLQHYQAARTHALPAPMCSTHTTDTQHTQRRALCVCPGSTPACMPASIQLRCTYAYPAAAFCAAPLPALLCLARVTTMATKAATKKTRDRLEGAQTGRQAQGATPHGKSGGQL